MVRKKIDENKTINASVRLKPTIYDFVMRTEGKSFNEKFNNFAEFCMTREVMLRSIEQEYEARLKILQKEIAELDARLQNHKDVKSSINRAYEAVNELYQSMK